MLRRKAWGINISSSFTLVRLVGVPKGERRNASRDPAAASSEGFQPPYRRLSWLGQEDGQPIRLWDLEGGGAVRTVLPRHPRPAREPAQRESKTQTGARRPGAVGNRDSVAHQWQQGGAP